MPDALQFLILTVAAWLNREQQVALDYLKRENEYLLEQLPPGRLRFTDAQRRRLATAAKGVGRAGLRELGCLVTPDTLLGWYRKLVARKYDGSQKRRGPGARKTEELVGLVLRIAREDPNASCRKIAAKLANLGLQISKSTVQRLLEEHGIDPPTESGTRWRTFLAAHWGHIYAADFMTVEVLTVRGLVRYHVLVVIDLASRVAELGGVAHEPGGEWVCNRMRELTNPVDGFMRRATHLIVDRDPVFTSELRVLLENSGVELVRLPPRSPNLNAYVERFIGSIRRELLRRVIPMSERHLRWLLKEYFEHYNHERPHQSLSGVPPLTLEAANGSGPIECRKRVGGLLCHYTRRVA